MLSICVRNAIASECLIVFAFEPVETPREFPIRNG
jgi:hypothetical protein